MFFSDISLAGQELQAAFKYETLVTVPLTQPLFLKVTWSKQPSNLQGSLEIFNSDDCATFHEKPKKGNLMWEKLEKTSRFDSEWAHLLHVSSWTTEL